MQQLYLIAHNVRSLYNVGSLFRSADGFGVDKVFLTGYTPAPENIIRDNGETCRQKKQIGKTALGAEEWVQWEQARKVGEITKKLKKAGVNIYALEIDKKAVDITQFTPKFPCALLVGNEVDGLDSRTLKLADEIISIPMLGKKDSLNVAVAAGVALYWLNRNRQ